MSNLVPPRFPRGPGINNPPPTGGYPGGQRPAPSNGLNSHSGFTWAGPEKSPRLTPPPSSPLSRIPPNLSRPPKLGPKPPGLGLLGTLKPTIPGLLLTGGLLLLDWWLSQPSPPPNTLPTEPVYPKDLPIGQAFQVYYTGTSFITGQPLNIEGSFTTWGPYTAFREVPFNFNTNVYQVEYTRRTGVDIYEVFTENATIPAAQFPVLVPTSGEPEDHRTSPGTVVTRGSLKITRIVSLPTNNLVNPLPPPTGPAPPYSLGPSPGPNAPPLAPPDPQNPNPFNPVPFGPPGTTPAFTPFPGPGKNKSDENENKTPPGPWFTPFPSPSDRSPFGSPFDFNPVPGSTDPTNRTYVTNDPVLRFGLDLPPNPLTHPVIEPNPNPNPNPNPTNPTNPTNPVPPTNKAPTTTAPPDPNKDKNPLPFFPPFPIVNPKDPKIENPTNNPPPVNQSPPGNNCCVPGSVDQKLDNANNKLDALTPTLQLLDLSALDAINAKLGPQLNGGLSGFLTDKFTKLWNSRVVDRTLNLLAVGASLHNAVMLSRDLGATLIETTGNVLAAVGIKNADGEAFDFNTIIGQTVENFVKSVIGTENYTNLKQTWVKANRILTAGANLIDSVRSMQNTMIEAQEIVGGWVAKIGNGLSRDGIVNDDSIDWMPERPDFKNPFFRAQQTIENLTEATESVNQLASAVIETQELRTQINTNYEAFKNEITVKSDEKKTTENAKKQESQSTDIDKSDLKEGAPSDAS